MKTIQSKQEKREEKKLVLATKRRAKAEEKLKDVGFVTPLIYGIDFQ